MNPGLPNGVKIIIERLEAHGKRAHIVGGCVRDFLLSKEPCDYDITTDALPWEMKEIFSDFKTVETGIKHGTLTVIFEGEPYEVTTYRVDGEYEDHRHPKSVEFTDSLLNDLSRRDFTMNAICYNERDGFVDLFSGIEDIKSKIIRAVGDPSLRFEEDALRILRAIRFAAILGFSVEEKTAKSALEKAKLLSSVSAERIYTEWKKLIGGKYAYGVIEKYRDIISVFLFSEPIILPDKDKFASASAEVRQLSLFALSEKCPAAKFSDFCDRMKTDSKTKKLGVSALENLSLPLLSAEDIRLGVIKLGEPTVRLIMQVNELCEIGACLPSRELGSVLGEGYPLSLSELAVGGDDMKALGFFGREIGETLTALLHMTAKDEVKNEREALLNKATQLKNGI